MCGGPFGSETAVQAGGALPALAGYVAAMGTWAVPQALYAAELSAMFPENAGFVPRATPLPAHLTYLAGRTARLLLSANTGD